VLDSLRATGGVERINEFAWLGAASMARFDATSHIVPSYQIAAGDCNLYATTPVAGCSAHWSGSAAAEVKAKRARKHHRAKRQRHRQGVPGLEVPGTSGPVDSGGGSAPTQSLPSVPKLPDVPPLPDVKAPNLPGQGNKQDPADKLLDFLLGK
jgi:hypothetical protein